MFLERHGLRVMGHNLKVEGGEIDLLAMDGRQRVVVEVRSRIGGGDPIDAADNLKRVRVAGLAADIGADRVDIVGVRFGADGVDVHWVPAAS